MAVENQTFPNFCHSFDVDGILLLNEWEMENERGRVRVRSKTHLIKNLWSPQRIFFP